MTWLKRLLKKRKAKKYYKNCLRMYNQHGYAASCGCPTSLKLMDYWQCKAEEAKKEYDKL